MYVWTWKWESRVVDAASPAVAPHTLIESTPWPVIPELCGWTDHGINGAKMSTKAIFRTGDSCFTAPSLAV